MLYLVFFLFLFSKTLFNLVFMAVEKLNPVALVVREFKASGISFKVMAARINRDPGSVQVMFTKENLSVERLMACSRALRYNFFLEIGYRIPYKGPANQKENPLMPQVMSLTKQLAERDAKINALESRLNDASEHLRKVEGDALLQQRILETELNTIKQVLKDILAARQI